MKKRVQIKSADGFSAGHYYHHEELFLDVICDINYNDIYSTWMSNSKDEVFRCLAEHQNEQNDTSNIVDFVILALAAVANITIVGYYFDGLTVKKHVFKQIQKHSIAVIEVCFISGYCDLIVDSTVRTELEYEIIIFK